MLIEQANVWEISSCDRGGNSASHELTPVDGLKSIALGFDPADGGQLMAVVRLGLPGPSSWSRMLAQPWLDCGLRRFLLLAEARVGLVAKRLDRLIHAGHESGPGRHRRAGCARAIAAESPSISSNSSEEWLAPEQALAGRAGPGRRDLGGRRPRPIARSRSASRA